MGGAGAAEIHRGGRVCPGSGPRSTGLGALGSPLPQRLTRLRWRRRSRPPAWSLSFTPRPVSGWELATGDRAAEGLLAYAAQIGATHVVYHACDLPDAPESEDALLFEARSLAALSVRAERLGVTIAIENLAPVFPGPESLSASPMVLRGLANRIGSERVGICLDLGHAHIVAERRRTSLEALLEPVLDRVTLFHLHDNLGARWLKNGAESGIDPLRLDLHLPPGRGTLPWRRVAPALAAHGAPLMLEVHPPHRPRAEELYSTTRELLSHEGRVGAQRAAVGAAAA